MNQLSPQFRILVRYFVGIALGYIITKYGLENIVVDQAALTETLTTIIIGLATELWYAYAKKRGGPT